MEFRTTRWALPLATALVVAAPAAWAQTEAAPPNQQAAPASQAAAQKEVSSKEVEQFAAAVADLQTHQAETDQKLAAVEEPADMARIQEESERKMRWAIEDKGLSVQRYQEILVAYQQDPTLQQQVMDHFRQAQ